MPPRHGLSEMLRDFLRYFSVKAPKKVRKARAEMKASGAAADESNDRLNRQLDQLESAIRAHWRRP